VEILGADVEGVVITVVNLGAHTGADLGDPVVVSVGTAGQGCMVAVGDRRLREDVERADPEGRVTADEQRAPCAARDRERDLGAGQSDLAAQRAAHVA
jgi:hypothetical protein